MTENVFGFCLMFKILKSLKTNKRMLNYYMFSNYNSSLSSIAFDKLMVFSFLPKKCALYLKKI